MMAVKVMQLKIRLALLLILSLLGTLYVSLAQENAVTAQQTATSTLESVEYHEVLRLGRGTIETISWHPNENIIAVGGSLGVWIYSSTMEEIVHLDNHHQAVQQVSWSPDGGKLLGVDVDGDVYIWDRATFQQINAFQIGPSNTNTLSWSPDGSLITFAIEADNQSGEVIQIYSLELAAVVRTLGNDPRTINALAWSPDGSLIAEAGGDPNIRLWSVDSGQVTDTMVGRSEETSTITWSPSGDRIVTTEPYNDIVRIWDVELGHIVRSIRVYSLTEAKWSPNGDKIAVLSSSYGIQVWDSSVVGLFTEFGTEDSLATSISWSPNGEFLARSLLNKLEVWRVQSTTIEASLEHSFPVNNVFWFPNEAKLAISYRYGTVDLLDIASREQTTILTETRQQLTISPNGNLLADLGPDGVRVWDIAEQQVIDQLDLADIFNQEIVDTNWYYYDVVGLSWNPDGNKLAIAKIYDLDIWDITSGEVTTITHDTLSNGVVGVAWSPDGSMLATASYDSTISIVDASSFELIGRLLEGPGGIFPRTISQPLAWNSDGTKIAILNTDEYQKLFDVHIQSSVATPTQPPLAVLQAHSDYIYTIAWSPDGSKLATASEDGTIAIWDANTFDLLMRIEEHFAGVTTISWATDGNQLASGSLDGTVRVWELE